jgi:hypothetical protein
MLPCGTPPPNGSEADSTTRPCAEQNTVSYLLQSVWLQLRIIARRLDLAIDRNRHSDGAHINVMTRIILISRELSTRGEIPVEFPR